MRYFDHDTDASNDEKIQALRLEHGGAAVDAYWTIVEQIYREETPLVFFGNRLGTNSLSHRLCIDVETLQKWVLTMVELGLLERCGEDESALISERMAANIDSYRKRVETARENGKKGGRKPRPRTNSKPSRKPTGNQVGTEGLSKPFTKNIGFIKKPIYRGEGAENAAPPSPSDEISSVPCCPLCDVPVSLDLSSGGFKCTNCGDTFQADKVKFRHIGEERF